MIIIQINESKTKSDNVYFNGEFDGQWACQADYFCVCMKKYIFNRNILLNLCNLSIQFRLSNRFKTKCVL